MYDIIKIPILSDFIGHSFEFLEDFHSPEGDYFFNAGIQFKITEIKKQWVSIKPYATINSGAKSLESLKDFLLNREKENFRNLEKSLVMWAEEPEKFQMIPYNERFGGYYTHTDGKLSLGSYLNDSKFWNSVEGYKRKIKESLGKIEKYEKFSKDTQKYVLSVINNSRSFNINEFNKIKFKRI